MITISRDHITLLHKMGKNNQEKKLPRGFPECWEQLDTLVQHVHCVTASVKYLMEQEKQECIPEEKEKQVNLTCWTALPWWCFSHVALLLAAPHRWQRRAPWVQSYLNFLDKYVIFLEFRVQSYLHFRQVRNIFGDTTKGAESKNNSSQWRMPLS